MKRYKTNKNNANKEKEKYENLLEKIRELKKGLSPIVEDLMDAETNFKNGGYVDKGVTFDNGVLKECYNKISNDIETLDSLVNSYQNKINGLKKDINGYQKKYETAKSNYQKAKAIESRGA